MENKKIIIDISTRSIIKIFATILALWFLFVIRDIIAILFIVFIMVAALDPVIDFLQKKGMPRILSLISIYLILIGVLILIGWAIIPPVGDQIQLLSKNIPSYLENLLPFIKEFATTENVAANLQKYLQSFSSQLANLGVGFLGVTKGVLSGLTAIILILILTFYILLENRTVKDYLKSILPPEQKDYIISVLKKIGTKMGQWLRGQILLMIIVGVLDAVGLLILGIPYWLALAMIAAVLEIIPTIGPILATIIGVILVLAISPWKALAVLILFFAVQQLENNIIVPKLMGKVLGLSPIVVILAILVGAKLMGILGAFLAVPLVAIGGLLWQEWSNIKIAFSKSKS